MEEEPIVYGISPFDSKGMKSDNPKAGIYLAETSRTLDLNGGSPACNQGGMVVVQKQNEAIGMDCYNQTLTGEKAVTISASATDPNHVPCCMEVVGVDGYNMTSTGDKTMAIRATASNPQHVPCCIENGTGEEKTMENEVQNNSVLRRLTPLECTRLQGFSDGIADVPKMNKDEYVAWVLATGKISVDPVSGAVFEKNRKTGETMEVETFLSEDGNKIATIRNCKSSVVCRVDRIVWISEKGVAGGMGLSHVDGNKSNCSMMNLLPAEGNPDLEFKDGDVCKPEVLFRLYEMGELVGSLTEVYGIAPERVAEIVYEKSWLDIGEWTDEKGKRHKETDGPKYKALGNSIALPFWEWMAERMAKYLPEDATMASLFSGIGGFELSFLKAGVKPVWNSEIEDFPIAVTKKHFGDGDELDGDCDIL